MLNWELLWGMVMSSLPMARIPRLGKMVEPHLTIPPYVPYRTFRNFVDQLRDGIPARIDRSVWGPRYSGSSGIQLMTALKVLGLVDEEGRPSPLLERLVNSEGEERRRVLRGILERHYQPAFALDLGRATRSQFTEAFRLFTTKEGVLKKCENFFIQAAQDAGIELSPYILARRHQTRRAGTPSRPRAAAPSPSTPARAGGRSDPGKASEGKPTALAFAEMVLAKYPDFDPTWEPEVQQKWLEGISRLYETLDKPNHPLPPGGG